MAKRYELPDAAWELIADLVSPKQKMGRPRSDDRLMARLARAARPMVDGISALS
ncbi:ISPs1a-2 [Stutzerimonas stutzeri TS44]|nr:ISPs1a-2 [Stutzerimonas stutzeri TS44]